MNVVYSADIGRHDHVWPAVPQTLPCEIVRFTGSEHPHGLSDRLASRWYKTHPHLLFPQAELTIWVDACIEITSPSFAADVAAQTATYTVFAHPDRDNVHDEYLACETLAKCAGNRHTEMLAALAEPVGLYALGVIARRGPQPVDEYVWDQTLRWSTRQSTARDQLIFPCSGFTPDRFDRNLWDNDWLTRHPHRRET